MRFWAKTFFNADINIHVFRILNTINREYENRRSVGPGPTNIRPDRQFFKLVGPADRQKIAVIQHWFYAGPIKKSAGPTNILYLSVRLTDKYLMVFTFSVIVYIKGGLIHKNSRYVFFVGSGFYGGNLSIRSVSAAKLCRLHVFLRSNSSINFR